MPQTNEERVEHALSKLLEHLLPPYPGEDPTAADERIDDAYGYALDVIGSAEEPGVASDVNHAADLIKKKLVRESNSPERALRFANLYSRLLTQPVLNSKWAMLYFLYQLSDSDIPAAAAIPPAAAPPSTAGSPFRNDARPALQSPIQSPGRAERQYLDATATYNEAFKPAGVQRLPPSDSPRPAKAAPAEKPQRERRAEKRQSKPSRPSTRDEETASKESEAVAKEDRLLKMEPSEPALLRDLPFTLQGLSSTNLKFTDPATLKLPTTLPPPIVSLLHTLAEPSLLYKRIAEFVEATDDGLVRQSFRSALGIELRAYLGLVATLEGQIRRALAMLDDSQPRQGIGMAGVTLKRCVIWTREATMGLRLMSLMVEQSKRKKGGQLISLIHSFSLSHGDPFVGTFAERLLTHVTRPFYDMLRQWIYDGELSDPYLEFFVEEQGDDPMDDTTAERKGGATSVWEDKYKLNAQMVPTIVTEEFANKVFLIGKTLNFIRHGCNDAGWVESYSKNTSRELRYGDTANLERSIGEAYKTTMARLIHLMSDKFHLFEHLQALKKYILLGAGDFIAVLMESLSANLDQPANTQYRHTLTAQLEHAVRNSNAQYDSPDVLRRLDSRMLELSHGEIGWDVFTLEYKIDAPVDVIVTPFGSKQYLKVFNFLWRVKRVEFALNSTWRRCMTASRQFLTHLADTLGSDWKRAHGDIASMIHFVNQLQYYILFEVIESSWNDLQASLHKPESTLDDMIDAHARYLDSITRKGLLGGSSGAGGEAFTGQLHGLLKVMLAFKAAVDGLYSFSTAEFARRQQRAATIETRTAAGRWGRTERDDGRLARSAADDDNDIPPLLPGVNGTTAGVSTDDAAILAALRERLTALSGEFRNRVQQLLGDLLFQKEDADMRWLAMVMNFNDVYQPVKSARKRSGVGRRGREGEREREGRREGQTPGVGGREEGERERRG